MDYRKKLKKIIINCMSNVNFDDKDLELLLIVGTLALTKIKNNHHLNTKVVKDLLTKYNVEFTKVAEILGVNKNLELRTSDNEYKKLVELFNYEGIDLENIVSWTYQYTKFGREKLAFENSLQRGLKIEGSDIVATTQFFTESYMIDYLVEEIIKENKDIYELKILDPCCGGGNFLTKIMETVYKTKCSLKEFNYFIENGIFGYELDMKLAKVASLNLYLKYISLVGNENNIKFNIFTSESSRMFGSLETNSTELIYNSWSKENIPYFEVLVEESFDIVITNPPFMGPRNMSKDLLDFLKDQYPKSKGDLCNSFIERCLILTKKEGYTGLVTQNSWLYLTNYEDLRRDIFSSVQIKKIVELGSDAFLDLNGEKTRIVLSIIKKQKSFEDILSINLSDLTFEEKKVFINNLDENIYGSVNQLSLLKDKDAAFKHASTDKFNQIFKETSLYNEYAIPMQGTSTGNSKELVDYSWNHPEDKDWTLVSKGGGYSRWNGLNYYRVKWGKDAEHIRATKGHALRNIKYFSETQLVFSDTGTQGMSVRALLPGQIFIASGPGIRINRGNKHAHLAFLNSRIANYFLSILSPKLTISAGYIGKIPVPKSVLYSEEIADLGERCLKIKEKLSSFKIDSFEYKSELYFKEKKENLFENIICELELELEKLKLERKIEGIIHNLYNLSKLEKNIINLKFGFPVLDFEKKAIALDIKLLDAEWSKIIDEACKFKGVGKKKKFGVDGVLEHLSQIYMIHPETLLKFISDNIEAFNKTILKYKYDETHKKILAALNYENHLCEKSITNISDLDLNGEEIEWLENGFIKWHKSVFKGTKLIQLTQKEVISVFRNKVE